MTIVHQTDKRSGITYAYKSEAYWDSEKQQSRAKRTLVGRVNKDGEVVPTDNRNRNASLKTKALPKQLPEVNLPVYSHKYFGATYFLDQISEKIGLTTDLKRIFPVGWEEILSVTYYLVLEDANPLFRFEHWDATHRHPFGRNITSQRSSELFAAITDNQRMDFFKLQAKRRIENEYWAYDTTSISSYSENLKHVQYGVNKDSDDTAQLNLALVFGEESGLPFYYRKLAGNVPDVKTVKTLLSELDVFELNSVKLCMDRAFPSETNINEMFSEHIKFLCGAKLSVKYIAEAVNSARDNITDFANYSENYETYGVCVPIKWDFAHAKSRGVGTVHDKRNCYLYVHFNPEKALEENRKFERNLSKYSNELKSGKMIDSHSKFYGKYFDVKTTKKECVTVTPKQEAIDEARRNFGFFAEISNEKMPADTALGIYRTRNVVERAYFNIKDRLNVRRLLVSSEESLEGKLFVEFIALILISYIEHQMKLKNIYNSYTFEQLLDKLDLIEQFEYPNGQVAIGEILLKQADILKKFEIATPTSL
jgi:transposase